MILKDTFIRSRWLPYFDDSSIFKGKEEFLPFPCVLKATRERDKKRATRKEVIENVVPVYRCPYVYLPFINSRGDNFFSKLRDRGATNVDAFVYPFYLQRESTIGFFPSYSGNKTIPIPLMARNNSGTIMGSRARTHNLAVERSVCGQTRARSRSSGYVQVPSCREERIIEQTSTSYPVQVFLRRLVASLARFQTSQLRASSIFVDSDLYRKTVTAFATAASSAIRDRRSSCSRPFFPSIASIYTLENSRRVPIAPLSLRAQIGRFDFVELYQSSNDLSKFFH